jgi:hypothetical protein
LAIVFTQRRGDYYETRVNVHLGIEDRDLCKKPVQLQPHFYLALSSEESGVTPVPSSNSMD